MRAGDAVSALAERVGQRLPERFEQVIEESAVTGTDVHLSGHPVRGWEQSDYGRDKLTVGLTVSLQVDGEAAGTAVVDEEGRWLIEGVDLGAQDGLRTLTAVVTDAYGNEWTSTSTVEVDIDGARPIEGGDTGSTPEPANDDPSVEGEQRPPSDDDVQVFLTSLLDDESDTGELFGEGAVLAPTDADGMYALPAAKTTDPMFDLAPPLPIDTVGMVIPDFH